MGKGGSEEKQISIVIILCKGTLNPIDLVRSLEGLAKIGSFLRVCSGEDFMIVDGRF